jgi:hypothetical protein
MSQTSSFLRNLVLTGGLSALVGANAVAATQLPGSVAPGRIQQEVVPLSRAMPVTQIHYAQFPTTKIEWQAKKWTPRLRRVLVRNQGIAADNKKCRSASRCHCAVLSPAGLFCRASRGA